MNRTYLLIAIAAIAVVGIAVGVFLSGAGQNDALSGMLGKQSTQTTFGATIVDETGLGGYLLNLHGKLCGPSGAGLANKPVTIWQKYPSDEFRVLTTLTTGADGTYAYSYEELPYWGVPLYFAQFAGDDLYNGSRSAETQHS